MKSVEETLKNHPDLDKAANEVYESIKDLTPSEAYAVLQIVEGLLNLPIDDMRLSGY